LHEEHPNKNASRFGGNDYQSNNGTIYWLITTETGRVLGASTSFFRYYKNPDTSVAYGTIEKAVTCVDGAAETIEVPNVIRETESTDEVSYEIRTPKVIEVVRNHFDCMTLTGVKLESKKGGTSCFGGFLDDVSTFHCNFRRHLHWNDSNLFTDSFVVASSISSLENS
jgi:antitoxin component HigA of HigAB toxin-antitoxin module